MSSLYKALWLDWETAALVSLFTNAGSAWPRWIAAVTLEQIKYKYIHKSHRTYTYIFIGNQNITNYVYSQFQCYNRSFNINIISQRHLATWYKNFCNGSTLQYWYPNCRMQKCWTHIMLNDIMSTWHVHMHGRTYKLPKWHFVNKLHCRTSEYWFFMLHKCQIVDVINCRSSFSSTIPPFAGFLLTIIPFCSVYRG
jgi:hypothetical protein